MVLLPSREEFLAMCRQPWSPRRVEQAPEEESDEGDESEAVLETRPLGIEIRSAHGGRGAVACCVAGVAEEAGIAPGSEILSINECFVEDLPIEEITGVLESAPLPVTLGLRLPPSVKKKGKSKITVCTVNCRGSYRVVSEAIALLGWQEAPQVTSDASVMWVEHSDSTDGLAPMQTMSRIEAFLHFCRKVRLATQLNTWVRLLPEEFAFSPETWVLPEDAAELEAAMSKSKDTFIAKPTAGSQGKGIVLARKWKDLEPLVQKSKMAAEIRGSSDYVVQRYFATPLLLDGLKFDLRLYAVVTSVVPLRAYLFREGLARFCTVPYQPPKDSNIQDACMHLTNYAVNKKSRDFQPTENLAQHGEGSKRSVSAVFQQIEQIYGASANDLWSKVSRLAANTLMALRPGLVEFYVHERPRPLHPVGPKGFQIIGLDVLIDGDMEPRLLELNANPSLSVMQPGGGLGAAEGDAEASDAPTASASLPELQQTAPRGVLQRQASKEENGPRRRPSKGARARAKSRLGIESRKDGEARPKTQVVNELDLAVKRELVVQALRLVKPAPAAKVSRLKKKWLQNPRAAAGCVVPLGDDGAWALSAPPTKAEAVRPDGAEDCPALEPLDFDELAAEEVADYARAHLAAYRCWARFCGQGQDTLGQAQMLKLMERLCMVGSGAAFPDRVSAQLWLSKAWRDTAGGAFGLSLPQFVALAERLGCLMLGRTESPPADGSEADGPNHAEGLVHFVSLAEN